jgi:hypothetical protein
MDDHALATELAIRKVIAQYCRGVDRQEWDLVRRCYHDDAVEEHGTFRGSASEFVAWVAEGHRDVEISIHLLGNIFVELAADDLAFAESYALGFIQTRGGDGEPTAIEGACRYVDRFERRDDRWAIAHRVLVLDFQRPIAPLAVPHGFTSGTQGRDDPSFAVWDRVMGDRPPGGSALLTS